MVIIFTKLFMACLTFGYCRVRLGFVHVRDFFFPVASGIISFGLFMALEPLITLTSRCGDDVDALFGGFIHYWA